MGLRFGITTHTAVPQVLQDEISNMKRDDAIRIKPRQARGLATPRSYYQVRADIGAPWDIPNNDIETVKHALMERVYFVKKDGKFQRPPRPWTSQAAQLLPEDQRMVFARKMFNERLTGFSKKFRVLANTFELCSPMTVDEFVDSYGGQKRQVYAHAAESLKDKPFNDRDSWVKVFTKDEYLKPGGAPRAIQPRSPRFNVNLGRYLKPIEHKVFETIDLVFDSTGKHRTVAKGMNMVDRGRTINEMWSSFSDPIAVGLDASRFDQHVHELALEYEHSQYPLFVKERGDGLPDLKRLLALTRNNVGVYHGKDGNIKYKVRGNRMSGDMNTSLGNVLIMCSLMYGYLESKALQGKVKLLNDGDDCVLIMDRRNLDVFREGLEEWFEEMGFTMCYDGIYKTLESIQFCQAHPVRNSSYGWMLVPRPTKRLYSDLVSTKPIHSRKVYRKWLGAVAGCGIASSHNVPVFGRFYQWLARGATPYLPVEGDAYRGYRMSLSDGLEMKYVPPTIDDRISFYFAYDITPEEQIIMERYYDTLLAPQWTKPELNVPRCLDPVQNLAFPEQKENS